MRRHRVHEDELPAVKWGLHRYLSQMCEYPEDTDQNIINAFRLFYRVINYKAGQPDYPGILDENGQIQYTVIENHLRVAEQTDPYLRIMVPFSTEGMGGGPGPLAHLLPQARTPATTQEESQ